MCITVHCTIIDAMAAASILNWIKRAYLYKNENIVRSRIGEDKKKEKECVEEADEVDKNMNLVARNSNLYHNGKKKFHIKNNIVILN